MSKDRVFRNPKNARRDARAKGRGAVSQLIAGRAARAHDLVSKLNAIYLALSEDPEQSREDHRLAMSCLKLATTMTQVASQAVSLQGIAPLFLEEYKRIRHYDHRALGEVMSALLLPENVEPTLQYAKNEALHKIAALIVIQDRVQKRLLEAVRPAFESEGIMPDRLDNAVLLRLQEELTEFTRLMRHMVELYVKTFEAELGPKKRQESEGERVATSPREAFRLMRGGAAPAQAIQAAHDAAQAVEILNRTLTPGADHSA